MTHSHEAIELEKKLEASIRNLKEDLQTSQSIKRSIVNFRRERKRLAELEAEAQTEDQEEDQEEEN